MTNIVKVKHFVHVDGSGMEGSVIESFEEFINSPKVNPIEISHSYQRMPVPVLSIFLVYADVEQVEKAAKEAVEASESTKEVTKKTDKKRTKKGKK